MARKKNRDQTSHARRYTPRRFVVKMVGQLALSGTLALMTNTRNGHNDQIVSCGFREALPRSIFLFNGEIPFSAQQGPSHQVVQDLSGEHLIKSKCPTLYYYEYGVLISLSADRAKISGTKPSCLSLFMDNGV